MNDKEIQSAEMWCWYRNLVTRFLCLFFAKKIVFISDRYVVITQKKMGFDLEIADFTRPLWRGRHVVIEWKITLVFELRLH